MFPLLVPHQFPAPVGEGKGVGSALCFHTCYWRDIRAVFISLAPAPVIVYLREGGYYWPHPCPSPTGEGNQRVMAWFTIFINSFWRFFGSYDFFYYLCNVSSWSRLLSRICYKRFILEIFFVQLSHALILRSLFLSLGIQSISIRILLAFHNNLLIVGLDELF